MDILGIGNTVLGLLKGVGILKDPEQELKATELAAKIDEAVDAHIDKRMESVNATMREEAKSEHWAQWLWRPMFGFTGSAILINNYILLPYFQKFGIVPIPVPGEVWLMIMAILGVAAYTRGQQKIEEAKKSNK